MDLSSVADVVSPVPMVEAIAARVSVVCVDVVTVVVEEDSWAVWSTVVD